VAKNTKQLLLRVFVFGCFVITDVILLIIALLARS